MNNHKSIIDELEPYLWPKTLGGWSVFFVAVLLTINLTKEIYSTASGYFQIIPWENKNARLEKLSIEDRANKSKFVRVEYSYEVNGIRYKGNRVDPDEQTVVQMTNKKIMELKKASEESNSIEIRYDPKNPKKSVYLSTPNDLYFMALIAIPILILSFLYILIIFRKIRNPRK